MTIIARKPKDNEGNEYVVVDRGTEIAGRYARYVSATVNAHSLDHDEWFWGHYFYSLEEAMAHFNGRR